MASSLKKLQLKFFQKWWRSNLFAWCKITMMCHVWVCSVARSCANRMWFLPGFYQQNLPQKQWGHCSLVTTTTTTTAEPQQHHSTTTILRLPDTWRKWPGIWLSHPLNTKHCYNSYLLTQNMTFLYVDIHFLSFRDGMYLYFSLVNPKPTSISYNR